VKPFRGKSITEIMSFMEKRGPEDIRVLNPAVPEALKRVISKSVAFDPAQRYAAAAAFAKALADALPVKVSEAKDRGAATPDAKAQTEAAFTVEMLHEIERDLARFIGPMASIAVRRAARQASDLLALYELLGRQVGSPKDRAEFLAIGRQRVAAGIGQPRPVPRPTSAKTTEQRPDHSVSAPNSASIVAIESDLTRYIGPIARILVKRELTKFESLAKLCLVLATHIPDERERRAFLNAHGAE
jgi:serine/threonine-protein kinase